MLCPSVLAELSKEGQVYMGSWFQGFLPIVAGRASHGGGPEKRERLRERGRGRE